MKKIIALTALAMVAGGAQAATYTISGGNWDSQTVWSSNATASVSTTLFDNGAAVPEPTFNFAPSPFTWTPDIGGNLMDGTYGGSITTDGSNNVTGGTLSVTGEIGFEIAPGPSSWWFITFDNLSIDFGTGLSTASVGCAEQAGFAPAPCFAATAGYPDSLFNPLAGHEDWGTAGTARAAATFDGTTLNIFREGYTVDGASGTDYLNTFTLSSSVVPVPAAVWLFGSALGLLGWGRRKA